jgi:uncharacterized protein YjiS (DUF1127 family)
MTFLESLGARYREWAEIRNAEAELSAFSDRELDDLGISRADIPYLVRQKHTGTVDLNDAYEPSARAVRRANAA